MKNRDFVNYCHIVFINGVSDAVSVTLLHKTFSVLMTGNLIFMITDISNVWSFKDMVRLTLILSFILMEFVWYKFLDNIQIGIKLLLSFTLLFTYIFLGSHYYGLHQIGENQINFLGLAILSGVLIFTINTTFQKIHEHKYNLILHTVNLLKLADLIAEKNYKSAIKPLLIIILFCSGLLFSALLIRRVNFYAMLLITPVLISLIAFNLDKISLKQKSINL
jgi:uncharacterized membrane protein YoaK (UPF0700 family)